MRIMTSAKTCTVSTSFVKDCSMADYVQCDEVDERGCRKKNIFTNWLVYRYPSLQSAEEVTGRHYLLSELPGNVKEHQVQLEGLPFSVAISNCL